MARMSIYVPDDLRGRMERLNDRVSWSNVAQAAFEAEIRLNPEWKEDKMTAVIERLRASKEKHMEASTEVGIRDGKKWAEESAAFACLKALGESNADDIEPEAFSLDAITRLIDEPHPEDFWESICGGYWQDQVNGWYMVGFVRGAKAVWEEVEHQL